MAQAGTAGKPGRAAQPSGPGSRPVDMDRLREHIAEPLLQAAEFISPVRVDETARGWLSRVEPVDDDPGRPMLRVADALGMALFTPSASGATAFDRLARRLGRLGADEAAARYLYELVERAFETETARFRAGETYAATPTPVRRTATHPFGIGLARGIAAKLRALRGSSGRDLVVVKADVVEAELAKLGLHFRTIRPF